MRFCVRCGAARDGAESFCVSCGNPFPQPMPIDPPAPPADLVETPGRWSTGRWSTPFVAAWVAVALVVAGTTVGVLVGRAEHTPSTRSAPDTGIRGLPGGPSLPSGQPDAPTETADTTDITGGGPTGDSTADSSTDSSDAAGGGPTGPESAPTDPNGVVSLSSTAALDPAAPAVLSLLSRYFQAINTRDYQLYRDVHTADSQASLDPDTFQLGFESTEDSDAVVTTIGVQPDGRPTADVAFTSHQDSVDGPEGDTCDRWNVTFFLDPDGDGYLIGAPPSTYHASHQAC